MEIFGKISGLSPTMSSEQVYNIAGEEEKNWKNWRNDIGHQVRDSTVLDRIIGISEAWLIVEKFFFGAKRKRDLGGLAEQLKLKPLVAYESIAGRLIRAFAGDDTPKRINDLLRYLYSLNGEITQVESSWALVNYVEELSRSELGELESVVAANYVSLSESISNIDSRTQKQMDDLGLVRSAVSNEFGRLNSQIDEGRSILDGLVASQPVSESEFLARHDLLRAELTERLGLKASSNGWGGGIRKLYKDRVRNLFISLALIAMLIAVYIGVLFFQGMEIWGGITKEILVMYSPSTISIPAAGIISAFTFSLFLLMSPLAFAVWLFRILLRTRDQQQNLEIDAEEREMMINTYADLTSLGYVREEDRATLLASIFRPKGSDLSGPEPAPNFGPLLDTVAALVVQNKNGTNPAGTGRG